MLVLGDIINYIPQAQPIRIYTYNKKLTLSGKETIFSGIRAQYDNRKLAMPVWSITESSGMIQIELI